MRKNSLAKEKEILWVLRGKPFFSKHLTIKARQNPENKDYKYTVVVSKKVFKKAVDRNKVKRRIRSVVRAQEQNINKKSSFVVLVKKAIIDISFVELEKQILTGLKQLSIVKNV